MSALPGQRQAVPVYIGNPGSFYDTVIVAGQVQDMSIATTLVFNVRRLESRAALIANNGVGFTPDNDGRNVRYDWQSNDIAVLGEGEMMAWWTFALSGSSAVDTPEFPIFLTDHGPGVASQIGVIVLGVTQFMPISLDALRKDERYGDQWLQNQAEVIKLRTMGTTVSPDSESTLGTVFLDYLSKRLAFHLIDPAIEYWSRQWQTATTSTTSEVVSYPNMIQTLRLLGQRLCKELAQEWRDLMAIQPGLAVRHVMPLPATTLSGLTDPGYVSKNPRRNEALLTGGFGWGLEYGVWPFP